MVTVDKILSIKLKEHSGNDDTTFYIRGFRLEKQNIAIIIYKFKHYDGACHIEIKTNITKNGV